MTDSKKPLIVHPNYVQLSKQICLELDCTPAYRPIRRWRLLNKMHRINCDYVKWYEDLIK